MSQRTRLPANLSQLFEGGVQVQSAVSRAVPGGQCGAADNLHRAIAS
jgi:hypothetical protein